MFDMNPLDLPNAALQHWIMLLVSGALGFIIGYIGRQTLIRQLEGQLATTESDLADCRQSAVPDEEAVLQRLSDRAGELNFARIGLATADAADDLKDIVGIGPVFEKRLHRLGIYTFRQLASFTPEDVRKLSDIIEYFPDRIEREDWVGQARAFYSRKS